MTTQASGLGSLNFDLAASYEDQYSSPASTVDTYDNDHGDIEGMGETGHLVSSMEDANYVTTSEDLEDFSMTDIDEGYWRKYPELRSGSMCQELKPSQVNELQIALNEAVEEFEFPARTDLFGNRFDDIKETIENTDDNETNDVKEDQKGS